MPSEKCSGCLILFLGSLSVVASAVAFPPDIFEPRYEVLNEGDINIGAIISMHTSADGRCSSNILEMSGIEFLEALLYAVRQVNHDDLLSGVTLGAYILDDCFSSSLAMMRAIQFMPTSVRQTRDGPSLSPGSQVPTCFASNHSSRVLKDISLADSTLSGLFLNKSFLGELHRTQAPKSACDNSSTVRPASLKTSSPGCARPKSQVGQQEGPKSSPPDMPRFFEVAGVIGAYTSQHSTSVAHVLQLFQLPQVSPSSTSDVLSDKKRFPFFLRTLPPDRDQVQAMAGIVRHFNWTYVSLVYSEDAYGQHSQTKLVEILSELGVCVAQSLTLPTSMEEKDYNIIITALRRYKQAHAVLLYADVKHVQPLMAAVERNGAQREFIWVASDATSTVFQHVPRVCESSLGSISVKARAVTPPEFVAYMREKVKERFNVTTDASTTESLACWVPANWSASEPISALRRLATDQEPVFPLAAFVIDAVYAFAHALKELLARNCPRARGLEARACVRKRSVHQYLKRVNFTGTNGPFEFDDNGDVLGAIEIRQCQKVKGRISNPRIGMWEHRFGSLNINAFTSQDALPESVCAHPCTAGQIYAFTRQTCCWTCVTCKPNEITKVNASGCEPCPRFQWPDEETRKRCKDIEVPLKPTNYIVALALQLAAVVGLVVSIITAFTFFLYRHQRVIRSSSRELSGVMLVGVASAYLLVFPLLATPSFTSCYCVHVGFGMTFTLVYAPLLVKTHRIFRIFHAGKQSAALPRCTSSASQIGIVAFVVLIQIATVTVSTILEPPAAELRQAVLTEKVVERLCHLPVGGVVAALAYNVLLVLVCTVLAFKTRSLPDNYNESRYIAFCVDTSLLVWLTFVPAYFTATLAAHKVLVLALALLINSSVNLSCLFLPRLHALYRAKRSAPPGGDKQISYGQIPLRVTTDAGGSFSCDGYHVSFRSSVSDFLPNTSCTSVNFESRRSLCQSQQRDQGKVAFRSRSSSKDSGCNSANAAVAGANDHMVESHKPRMADDVRDAAHITMTSNRSDASIITNMTLPDSDIVSGGSGNGTSVSFTLCNSSNHVISSGSYDVMQISSDTTSDISK